MESSQEQPNPKRQRKNDESPDEPKEPLKIDDLNDFCLLNIFERLDAESLSNVADANKRLRLLAMDVYKRKFGAKTVGMNVSEPQPILWNRNIGFPILKPMVVGDIQIIGLKECLQHLRNFGPYIYGLLINYNDPNTKHYAYIHEYVNDFCAERLVEIKFQNLPNIPIEQFQKVFVNIRNVSFVNCDLGDKWPSFVQRFPYLCNLHVDDVRMVYRSIKKPFPNLEHLCIKDIIADKFTSIEIVADLLDGINQLKCLEIGEKIRPITTLLDLIKDNPSITDLTVNQCVAFVTPADVQRIISAHPALIKLDLAFIFEPDDVMALTRELASLKHFKFLGSIYDFNDNFDSQLENDGWRIYEKLFERLATTYYVIEKNRQA